MSCSVTDNFEVIMAVTCGSINDFMMASEIITLTSKTHISLGLTNGFETQDDACYMYNILIDLKMTKIDNDRD